MQVPALSLSVPSLVFWALSSLLYGCAPVSASVAASHAHEDPEPVAVTVFTDEVELFMEYPRLVPGLEGRFLAHVTVLATGAPVRTGRLTLRLQRAGGAPESFEAPRPTRDGLFIPVVSLRDPGSYEASIVVESDQVTALIELAPIVVHPDLASAHEMAAAEQVDEPRDAVPYLLEQQWQVGLLLEQVEQRTLVRRLQVPAEVEAPQGAAAVVSPPLGGRLGPPEGGRLPRIGERVEQGQVLALLELPLSTADLAQVSATRIDQETLDLELLLREFDMAKSALEVERSQFQSLARLEFAQQALGRLEGLREKGLGTAAEGEAALRDFELARRELEAARGLADSFVEARERLAALRAGSQVRRAAAAFPEPMRIPLIAPIAGEVLAAEHIEGEQVEAHGAVYELLDLERAWIKVHVSEFDLHEVPETPGALLELAADPGRSYDVVRDLQGRLVNFGRVIDPQTRTIPLHYEVQNPGGLLRVGMFADVFLETATAAAAVALPREAVVMDGGRPVAFVLVTGELFQKRVLELGIRDGPWVEVKAGVLAGERVATRGAYLVKLASASPASFGAGHAH